MSFSNEFDEYDKKVVYDPSYTEVKLEDVPV